MGLGRGLPWEMISFSKPLINGGKEGGEEEVIIDVITSARESRPIAAIRGGAAEMGTEEIRISTGKTGGAIIGTAITREAGIISTRIPFSLLEAAKAVEMGTTGSAGCHQTLLLPLFLETQTWTPKSKTRILKTSAHPVAAGSEAQTTILAETATEEEETLAAAAEDVLTTNPALANALAE